MRAFLILIISIVIVNSSICQIDSSRLFKTNSGCLIYDLYADLGIVYEWKGNCIDGFASGKGICKFISEEVEIAILEGEFSKGIPIGICTLKINDEKEYICQYQNGRMLGTGTLKLSDGEFYQGEIRDLKAHGLGKIIYSNGSIFTGKFKHGSFWTGYYLDLQDVTSYFQLGVLTDSLPELTKYKPLLKQELTEYFDNEWNRCAKNIAVYFRKITYKEDNIPTGIVKDYYISGAIMRKGYYSYIDYADELMNFKDFGPVSYYYENGNVTFESQVNYWGYYSGPTKSYFDNGQVKSVYNLNKYELLDGHRVYYDEKNKMVNYAYYENDELSNGKYFKIVENVMWSEVYEEDFVKNLVFWNGDKESTIVQLKDDRLFVNLENSNFYFRTKFLDVNKESQFRFQSHISTMKKNFKKDAYVGIIFDYKDANNYSEFVVDAKNTGMIVKYSDGKEAIVGEQKLTKENLDISNGINHYYFTITFFDNGIKFYLNGQAIHKMVEWEWQGDEFGATAYGKNNCLINSLEITEFFSVEESADFTKYVENKVLNSTNSEYDANGSGFFISRQGHIVTNYHVIEGAKEIDVKMNLNGKVETFPALVVIEDKFNDLAILKIDFKNFDLGQDIPYKLDFGLKEVGTEVYTLGYPMVDLMGSEIKFTDGKISSKSGLEGDVRTYQITTPIQPGNSGGPLFDNDGNIIGVISSTLNRENYNAENVNFAIKSNLIRNLIDASPEEIISSDSKSVKKPTLVDQIKIYKEFVPLILIKE